MVEISVSKFELQTNYQKKINLSFQPTCEFR